MSTNEQIAEAVITYVQDRDVLQRAAVPEQVADLVRTTHQSTWCQSRECERVTHTRSGTRAGDLCRA